MKETFKFIDLFAGIGGFHLAMQRLGGECVFASEMDTYARKTYEHNFKKHNPKLFNDNLFNDDIRKVTPSDIPDFDVLCAGFPCQPFSQAGFKRGFNDNHNSERGNLFFNIVDIIEEKKPAAIFLENVRGIISHDNGNTFKVIRNIIESELGYSFYYKIVKASHYGLPQLRPRAFMIGFRDEGMMRGFNFPPPIPLKFTMSDVWGGNCSREIGFTIRVGGRGSKIDDRRNWDAYLVDGEIKQLSHKEGLKMQGFPNDYEFPVSNTQAIKQLGNSVAVDAVEIVGKQMIQHLNNLTIKTMSKTKNTKNKGEWTELLVFVKLLAEQQLHLSDADLNPKPELLQIKKVSTQNLDLDFFIINNSTLEIKHKKDGTTSSLDISKIINPSILNNLTEKIKSSSGTFTIPDFEIIQTALGFNIVKGGTSRQKADINLDIQHNGLEMSNQGFGIKSYLGSKPTLLNASSNTNFIFELSDFSVDKMEEVNNINDKQQKLIKRITKIEALGSKLKFIGAEKDAMKYNLKLIDSAMPNIIGYVLLSFFQDRISSIPKIIADIDAKGVLKKEIDYENKASLSVKIKDLLVAILLGLFAGEKWDGEYKSNGTIVMKETGDCLGFHIIDLPALRSYLYQNIKLDTPSTTRHRFGKVYMEKNGKFYFKLNLQLRF